VIIGAIILEKCNIEDLKRQLYSKAEKFFRTRAKLVKIMGKYYYKRMDDEEFKSKMPRFCKIDESVRSE
jgi:hypothetical protein